MPRRANGQVGPKKVRELLRLPTLPPPLQSRAVSICIPDDPSWRALFWGHLNSLGSWLQYERDPDKRGKPIADVWRDIISESISISLKEDEVTDCMAQKIKDAVCEAIASCLEPVMASRHAELLALLAAIDGRTVTIGDYVVSVSSVVNSISNRVTNTTYNNLPPTPEERTGAQPITETVQTGLTDAEFYGICVAVVDGIVQALVDWFEELEAISNALELASQIAGAIPIPIIGDIADAAADAAVLVDWIQETAVEYFLAADTLPRRLMLADKIYCKGLPQKAITMPIIGESLAEGYLSDAIDWDDPIGSLAEIASGMFIPEQIFYMSLGIGLAAWTITGNFQGLITRASWRHWVNTGRNNPQSPTPDCGVTTGNASIRVGGGYVLNGVSYPGSAEPIALTLSVGDVLTLNSTSWANPYYYSGNPRMHNLMGIWVAEGESFRLSVTSTTNIWYTMAGTAYEEDGGAAYTNELVEYAWVSFPWNAAGSTSATFTIQAIGG